MHYQDHHINTNTNACTSTDGDIYFDVFQLALESRFPRVMEVAIDGIQLLIEKGYINIQINNDVNKALRENSTAGKVPHSKRHFHKFITHANASTSTSTGTIAMATSVSSGSGANMNIDEVAANAATSATSASEQNARTDGGITHSSNARPNSNTTAAIAMAPAMNMSLIEHIVECLALISESETDEQVQCSLLKLFLTISTYTTASTSVSASASPLASALYINMNPIILLSHITHGRMLLIIVRSCFHIHISTSATWNSSVKLQCQTVLENIFKILLFKIEMNSHGNSNSNGNSNGNGNGNANISHVVDENCSDTDSVLVSQLDAINENNDRISMTLNQKQQTGFDNIIDASNASVDRDITNSATKSNIILCDKDGNDTSSYQPCDVEQGEKGAFEPLLRHFFSPHHQQQCHLSLYLFLSTIFEWSYSGAYDANCTSGSNYVSSVLTLTQEQGQEHIYDDTAHTTPQNLTQAGTAITSETLTFPYNINTPTHPLVVLSETQSSNVKILALEIIMSAIQNDATGAVFHRNDAYVCIFSIIFSLIFPTYVNLVSIPTPPTHPKPL